MTGPAAKGRKLFSLAAAVVATAATLLAPTPAGASRYSPTALEPSLGPPVVDLAAACSPDSPELTLLSAGDLALLDPADAVRLASRQRFRLLEGSGARNLASGVSTWGREANDKHGGYLRSESQWGIRFLEPDPLGPVDSPNLYQAFGYDSFSVTDPLGLLLPRAVLADPDHPLYKHDGGWYQVNDQGLVYEIDIEDGARHSWVKDEAVVAAVLQQAGICPGTGDNSGLGAMGEVAREQPLPVAEAIDKAVAVGTSLSPLGDINDAIAAATGVDPLSGERLGLGGRLLSGAGAALPVVTGKELRGAVGLLESAFDTLADSRRGALGVVDDLPTLETVDEIPRGGTYVLRDPASDTVARTGRSKDLSRRRVEHKRDPRFADLEFEEIHRTDDYVEQRGLEQMLHDLHKAPLDRIRAISERNPRLRQYLEAAGEYLEKLKGP